MELTWSFLHTGDLRVTVKQRWNNSHETIDNNSDKKKNSGRLIESRHYTLQYQHWPNSQGLSVHSCTKGDTHIYTVNHKKRATLFLIITLAFLGRFLYFLRQWKQEWILYKKVHKIYHFTLTVSPNYLVKLKPRVSVNSTFWTQSSQCVQPNRLFATFAESRPVFVFSNFSVQVVSSFVSLLAEKLSHSQVSCKNFYGCLQTQCT